MESPYLSDDLREAYGDELGRILSALSLALGREWEWRHSLERTGDTLITTFGLRPTLGCLGDFFRLPSFNRDDGFVLGCAISRTTPHLACVETLTLAVKRCIMRANTAITEFPGQQLACFYTLVDKSENTISHMLSKDILLPFRNTDDCLVFSHKYGALLSGLSEIVTKFEIGLIPNGFYLSTTDTGGTVIRDERTGIRASITDCLIPLPK